MADTVAPTSRAGQLESQLREVCEQLVADLRLGAATDDAAAVAHAVDQLLAVVSRAIGRDPDAPRDEYGRARGGSVLQLQLAVNLFQDEIDAAILDGLPDLAARRPAIEWVSPVADDRYREYREGGFLAALDLEALEPKLEAFWPERGPRWDGLARLRFPDAERPGVLLVEAKSHATALSGEACQAVAASRRRIEQRLTGIASRFGIAEVPACWLEDCYQYINRLAHLFFLRDQGVDAWLAHIYFAGDWDKPTSADAWRDAIAAMRRRMGIPPASIRRAADIVVPARKLLALSLPVR